MRKLKVYLDTSAVSYLLADDTPEKMEDTRSFWQDLAVGKYSIVLSDVTIDELNHCPEEKLSMLLDYLGQLQFSISVTEDEIRGLAEQYIENAVLRPKSYDDCLHIAHAVRSGCDLLVSWNFKHLVNFKTIKGVRIVNALNNYNEIGIVSPTMLLEEEEP